MLISVWVSAKDFVIASLVPSVILITISRFFTIPYEWVMVATTVPVAGWGGNKIILAYQMKGPETIFLLDFYEFSGITFLHQFILYRSL